MALVKNKLSRRLEYSLFHIRWHLKNILELSLLAGFMLMGCTQVGSDVEKSPTLEPMTSTVTPSPMITIPPTGQEVLVSINTRNGQESFGTSEDVILHVIITNPNSYSIGLLKWFTPIEGVQGSLFTVLRVGKPVTYLGMLVKRAAPTGQDYITLAAGKSLDCDIKLSAYYDLSAPGNYEVTYNVSSLQLFAKPAGQPSLSTDSLISNTLQISVK